MFKEEFDLKAKNVFNSVEELKRDFVQLITNREIPLEERWGYFCHQRAKLPHGPGMDYRLLDSLQQFLSAIDFLYFLDPPWNTEEYLKGWFNEVGFIKGDCVYTYYLVDIMQLDPARKIEFKEKILEKNLYGFRFNY